MAVTRAKDRLHLLQPRWRKTPDGGFFDCAASRFLRELPDGLVDFRPDSSSGRSVSSWGGGWDGGGDDAPVYRPGGGRPRGGGWGWSGGRGGGGRRIHVSFNW